MDSQPSEAFDLLARFQESARRGDWAGAGKLADELTRESVPVTPVELGEYLRRLQQALAVARASRAAAAGSLRRLRAVANFNRAGIESRLKRQNFVDLTSY